MKRCVTLGYVACVAEFPSMGSRPPAAAHLTRVVVHRAVRPIHDTARGPAGRARSRPGWTACTNRARRTAANLTISLGNHTRRQPDAAALYPAPRRQPAGFRSLTVPGVAYVDPAALRDVHRRGDERPRSYVRAGNAR